MKRTPFKRKDPTEIKKKVAKKQIPKTTKLTVSQREEEILKRYRALMRDKEVTPSDMLKGKSNATKMANIAWAIFSNYIRKRDHKKYKGKCYTCNRVLQRWQDMSANHYITRSRKSTLFDEINVTGGCNVCNNPAMGNGMPRTYAANLDSEHGDGTARKLYQKSQQTVKADFWWFLETAEKYINLI